MNSILFHQKRFIIKYESLYMIFSILLYIYFLIATFGTFGEVKDRSNYYLTFDYLNNYSSQLKLLTGSSFLYGIFSFFGNSFLMLSIYSIIFLTAKLFLLKKILGSWAFILLYLVKFAFVIDLILLKESLGLLLILFSYYSKNRILSYVYIFLALLSHLSVTLLSLIRIGKVVLFIILPLLLIFVIYTFSEISIIYYYLDKINFYNSNGDSFLYQNPIFWMSTILLFYSFAHLIWFGKYRLKLLAIQFAVFIVGLLHPLMGIPAFRIWQVGSFADLLALKYLNSKILFALYLTVNLLFLLYGTIFLQGYLN